MNKNGVLLGPRRGNPSDREAWLRIAEEWMKLALTRDQPIGGVMSALSRIYASR
jgi:hypothetical protein